MDVILVAAIEAKTKNHVAKQWVRLRASIIRLYSFNLAIHIIPIISSVALREVNRSHIEGALSKLNVKLPLPSCVMNSLTRRSFTEGVDRSACGQSVILSSRIQILRKRTG